MELPIVLFVDDDDAVVDSARMLLESAGIEVHTAPDGQSAIDSLATGMHPDILICDYRMPGMNGVEVVRVARDLLSNDLTAIIMSGDTSAETIDAAMLSNCTMLRKPFHPDMLLTLVQRIN